ncbi:MAG: alpha/beta fold hydrolase [Paracoccaceae bacterium]
MLHTVSHHGDRTAISTPLVIAHGLFGSARNWGVISRRLSGSRDVVAVDMRNHGQSDWFDHHSYADMAADLSDVIAAHAGRADILGHSMGGKAAMVLALTRPEVVRRLIVADIAPVAYGHTQSHLIHAMRRLECDRIQTRRDADELLSGEIDDVATRAFLLQSLDIKTTPPRWRLNLAALERNMVDITGFPEVGATFSGPTLFLKGSSSDYILDEHRNRIEALFPNSRIETIQDAGHWLHAENPHALEAAIHRFLSA